MNEANILNFELGPENELQLVKKFKSFQRQYLAVYLLVMGRLHCVRGENHVVGYKANTRNMTKAPTGYKALIYTSYTTRMGLI